MHLKQTEWNLEPFCEYRFEVDRNSVASNIDVGTANSAYSSALNTSTNVVSLQLPISPFSNAAISLGQSTRTSNGTKVIDDEDLADVEESCKSKKYIVIDAAISSKSRGLAVAIAEGAAIRITLLQGRAEIWGEEMIQGQPLFFPNHSQGAIFTWHGALIEVTGLPAVEYIGRSGTCMGPLYTLSLALQQRRNMLQGTFDQDPYKHDQEYNEEAYEEEKEDIGKDLGDKDLLCVAAPRILVIGAGRNSVVRTLINYAVKMGDNPWLVDLDIANGLISLPGCIGCCQVTVGHHGIRHEEGGIVAAAPSYAYEGQESEDETDNEAKAPNNCNPLLYWVGSTVIGDDVGSNAMSWAYNNHGSGSGANVYKPSFSTFGRICKRMFSRLRERLEKTSQPSPQNSQKPVACSSFIVNFPAWNDKHGYKLLNLVVQQLRIDTIIVLGNERLTSEISKRFSSKTAKTSKSATSLSTNFESGNFFNFNLKHAVSVVPLPTSGGLVTKNLAVRQAELERKAYIYFYGAHTEFSPVSQTLSFSDVTIRQLSQGILAPSSALPIGAKRRVGACKLFQVEMNKANLLHRLLAVTHAQINDETADALDLPESDAFQVFKHNLNVAAFVCITEVDEVRQRFTILSSSVLPQIRSNILLLGDASLSWKE